MECNKVLFGGPLTFDLANVVGSLGEFVLSCLKQQDPDKTAFVDATSDKTLKYHELIDGSLRVAAFLRELGIGKGDVVSIFADNCLEFPLIVYGCFYLGATVNACNPAYTGDEVRHVLHMTQPRIVFTTGRALEKIISVTTKCDPKTEIVSLENSSSSKLWIFKDILRNKKLKMEENFVPEPVDVLNTVGLIQMSSGTTGLLKAVANTQDNILASMSSGIQSRGGEPSPYASVFLSVPFCHTYGMFFTIIPILGGVTIIFMRKFSGEAFLKSIQKYKIECLALVPSLWVYLIKSPLVNKYDLSSVKSVLSGAAALTKEVEHGMSKRFKTAQFGQGYGMTESTLSVISRQNEIYKAGSIGTLNPGVYCKVMDPDTGNICGENEAGELWFKGRVVMKGYLGNEEATREIIDSDGWLHTGDVGFYDENRHFYIVDRLKELIKYKGYQVPPAQLEDILLGHSAVLDAAVIGVPDAMCGELPRAFIVKKPKSNVTEKDLMDLVASKVSQEKYLRGGVQFVRAIPRNPNGKIMRRYLRNQAMDPKAKL